MTQQVFADFIGTTPATLSGIFNDRTRPTINIVEAIKKKIPDINTDWLMFGFGEMYHTPQPLHSEDQPKSQEGQTAQNRSESLFDFDFSQSPTPKNYGSPTPQNNSVRTTRSDNRRDEMNYFDKPTRHVTEIRVYYDDQTWESFAPKK